MHTASVVHDDINDHGVLRRGRPSINSVWGRTFALLTGDFLFTAVYQLMAPYGTLNKDLAAAATALVEGETLQAWAVKNQQFTREVYADIIARKTAALFQAAATIGAKLGNARPDVVEALGRFGFNVGLAFQITDDILDIVGEEEILGKTSGIDMEQGRGFAATETNGHNGANGHSSELDQAQESIKRKLLAGDRLNEARSQAHAFKDMAINELRVLPDSAVKTELIALANAVVVRDR